MTIAADKMATLEIQPDLTRGPIRWTEFYGCLFLPLPIAILSGLVEWLFQGEWKFPEISFPLVTGTVLFAFNYSKYKDVGELFNDERIGNYVAVQGGLLFLVMMSGVTTTNNSSGVLYDLIHLPLAISPFLLLLNSTLGHRVLVTHQAYTPQKRRRSLSGAKAIPVDDLKEMLPGVTAGPLQIATLRVFDMTAPDLKQAWDTKNVVAIEALLKKGDALTRTSWDTATGIFNEVGDRIDKARGNLSRLIRKSEKEIKRFRIDYSAIRLERSGILELTVQPLVTKKSLPTRYKPNLGGVISQTSQGNLPWQVTIPLTIAAVVIGSAIADQRALRKLKELEGQLSQQAVIASGDIAIFRTVLETRMVPQFSALVNISEEIEDNVHLLQRVVPASSLAKETAFRLASALLEAKHVLKMMAGD